MLVWLQALRSSLELVKAYLRGLVLEALPSSNVIREHSLHLFARRHHQRTCDFHDVPPVHLRRACKTCLPVSRNLKGHNLARQRFHPPRINHFTTFCFTASLTASPHFSKIS